jgi:rod shape determining protein RodA
MLRINRRLVKNFDWLTFAIVLLLSIIGVLTIFSATRQPDEAAQAPYYLKQIVWLLVGICGLIVFVSFDYMWLGRLSVPLYIVGLLLLVYVLISGKTGMGAQRWISLGSVSFQPSELFKVIFIITLSNYLSFAKESLGMTEFFRLLLFMVLLPLILIFKQPDLGTATLMAVLFFLLILTKGIKRKALVLIITIGIISLPFIGSIMWTGLKDYQKNRIIAFVEPEVDPSGIGYHISQSKIAIGSGELFGKGFMKGTQGPFRFLPEKHTDFIFAAFAEEWGFLGSAFVLSLYFLLIMRGLDTAKKAKDDFGRLLALGITFMISIYLFINIGMTLGVMPVVGIPLPFMSYGGTALLTNFVAIGILINIRTRRFALFY